MQMDYSEILQFITIKNEAKVILLVDCEELAVLIQLQFPMTRIYLGQEKSLGTKVISLEGRLLKEKETYPLIKFTFDYIIVGGFLEANKKPDDFLRLVLTYLKADGEFLASVYNSNHWSNLEKDNQGQWVYKARNEQIYGDRRFFSLAEITQLFEQVQCKEIKFSAVYQKAPVAVLAAMQREGLSNEHGELEVLRWGICATKVNKKALVLRKSFDVQTRTKMVFLLRRIENQMNITENCAELWQICIKKEVAAAYLVAMVMNTMLYPDRVLVLIGIYLYEQGNIIFAIELLKEGYRFNEDADNLIYTLVSLLCLQNRKAEIEDILCLYNGIDEDVLYFKKQMREVENEG